MQINPSAITNPSALTQQAVASQRNTTTAAASDKTVFGTIEQPGKSVDRDANGQYEASPQTPGQREKEADPRREDGDCSQSILSLPADDGQQHLIDIQG
jgi:hypothetical protein